MIWLWEHGFELFFLFLFPILGIAFDFLFTPRTNSYILIIFCLLLCPILTGYSYISSIANPFFSLIILSIAYSFYSKTQSKQKYKILRAMGISGLLFPFFAWFAFMDAFAGSQSSVKGWDIENYNVQYIYDQGFSGGTLKKYELNRYGFFKIFIKNIDVVVDNDTTNSCNFIFVDSKMVFNKCSGTLEKTNQIQR